MYNLQAVEIFIRVHDVVCMRVCVCVCAASLVTTRP